MGKEPWCARASPDAVGLRSETCCRACHPVRDAMASRPVLSGNRPLSEADPVMAGLVQAEKERMPLNFSSDSDFFPNS